MILVFQTVVIYFGAKIRHSKLVSCLW